MTIPQDSAGPFPRLLTEGLWVVGNYYFNLYLIKGEQAAALIEVGVSAVVDEVIRQLDALRISPTFLVVTHPHADHVTGIDGLRERYRDALVVTGEGAQEFLEHPKSGPALVREDQHMFAFLAAHGLPPGRPPVSGPPSLQNFLVAGDGDTMDLGGRSLRFLSVAGHAPGKIVVHVPEVGALILSDSLGFRFPGRGVFPLFLTDYAEYMATLDRLERLSPSLVGVAHQGPLMGRDVPVAFEESRRRAQALRERIIADPRDAEEIAEELFHDYYRDELTMYTPENILTCTRLIVKRARE